MALRAEARRSTEADGLRGFSHSYSFLHTTALRSSFLFRAHAEELFSSMASTFTLYRPPPGHLLHRVSASSFVVLAREAGEAHRAPPAPPPAAASSPRGSVHRLQDVQEALSTTEKTATV